jgi:hypothetical protein
MYLEYAIISYQICKYLFTLSVFLNIQTLISLGIAQRFVDLIILGLLLPI